MQRTTAQQAQLETAWLLKCKMEQHPTLDPHSNYSSLIDLVLLSTTF